jgi:photosystem II stability/assembly factor-like uncharacterized protein
MRAFRHSLLPLAASLALCGASFAQPIDPSLFSDLRWRLIGPFRGGRVLAAAGVPGEPDHFYFGSVGGGVWESKNAGRTWSPIFDSQPAASIGALAVSPSDPRVIYVGSGEADMRSDIACGNGVYVSRDGGRTWARSGLADSHQIGRIAVDPRDSNVAFVAALGHAYGPNRERGLYRTLDGGHSWVRVLEKDADTGAIDVAIDPAHPDRLLAALWQTRRPPWSTYPPSYGPGSGLYRSNDGGSHWTPVLGNGFPSEGLGRVGLAFVPSKPGRVFAVVDAKDGGLYRSEDGGESWRKVSGDPRIWERGWYFGSISVDPRNPDVVYACDTALYRSMDGGETFAPFKGAPGGDDYHQFWIDPSDPRRMIFGSDQGAAVTRDGGATWSSWYNQPTAQLYHVATDSLFPYRVYAAQQDSGAARVSSQSDWQAILPWDWRPVAVGYENGYIAPDPLDPGTVFGAGVTRFDLDTLQNRDVSPERTDPRQHRRTWTLPLVFSRRDPKVLYYANQRLFRSSDRGKSWTAISPDLSRENPAVPATVDPVTAADSPVSGPRRGVIYTIAPSSVRDGRIWCGTDDGLLWRTDDEGRHWTDVTPENLSAWSTISLLEASRFDAETAYAAVDRHGLDDFRAHILVTRDGGRSWKENAAGIPDGSFVHVVREDTIRRGLLYAGTETGVFVSFNDGSSWQPLRQNLPVCSVRDIDVHGSDLVVATHGRSLWILDDVSPLRQIASGIDRSHPWLFSPEPAVRMHAAAFQGTPVPKDEAFGENRPTGAFLDYWLPERASAPVAIVILDSAGREIRRFSTADVAKLPEASTLRYTLDWEPAPPKLSADRGMHRFVWDLLAAPRAGPAISGDETPEGGLRMPPGLYTVRLDAAGRSLEQKLELRRDPRLRASDADLVRQYTLAREVEELRVRMNPPLREAAAVRKALAALSQDARPEIRLEAARLLSRVEALAGSADEMALRSAEMDLETVNGLGWALRILAGSVESADDAPSVNDREAVVLHALAVEKLSLEWKNLVDADVRSFDEKARKAGRAPVLPR